MTPPAAHKWAFAPRFRRHAFGWCSQPAVQRVREAAAEIQKVAKLDPALAAVGAVLFLEKVSPALEQVDSVVGAGSNMPSSGRVQIADEIASPWPEGVAGQTGADRDQTLAWDWPR